MKPSLIALAMAAFVPLFLWCSGRGNSLVLTHGFKKKTQKTPKEEIEIAQRWKKMYLQSTPKP